MKMKMWFENFFSNQIRNLFMTFRGDGISVYLFMARLGHIGTLELK